MALQHHAARRDLEATYRRWLQVIAEQQPPSPEKLDTYRSCLIEALLSRGLWENSRPHLEEAPALCRTKLAESRARGDNPSTFTLNRILSALAVREFGTVRFEEIAAVYRAEPLHPSKTPEAWAERQLRGYVLRAWGEREPGTARLEEAVALYRFLVTEVKAHKRTAKPENLPRHERQNFWGHALSDALEGLGAALRSLAERNTRQSRHSTAHRGCSCI